MTLKERVDALASRVGNYLRDNVLPRLLPAGGTTGQVLRKSANSDYATEWANATGGVSINDGAASTSSTYSSTKIEAVAAAAATAAKNDILGGAGAAYDTLAEIQAELTDNDSSIAGLLTSVGNRVRFDASQTLSAAQKTQACTNLGIGEPDSDWVGVFNAALV
jgi:hypothetical protein